jgi:hypothetical protein
MDPGFSQLAVLWEREKTQSIAFGSSVVAPKRASPDLEKKNGETPVVQQSINSIKVLFIFASQGLRFGSPFCKQRCHFPFWFQ